MGEDDKLDYNPIEKYLKCKELKHLGFTEKQIAEFMSEKESQIKQWLEILTLMEEYLQEYDYDGIYTRLEKQKAHSLTWKTIWIPILNVELMFAMWIGIIQIPIYRTLSWFVLIT